MLAHTFYQQFQGSWSIHNHLFQENFQLAIHVWEWWDFLLCSISYLYYECKIVHTPTDYTETKHSCNDHKMEHKCLLSATADSLKGLYSHLQHCPLTVLAVRVGVLLPIVLGLKARLWGHIIYDTAGDRCIATVKYRDSSTIIWDSRADNNVQVTIILRWLLRQVLLYFRIHHMYWYSILTKVTVMY